MRIQDILYPAVASRSHPKTTGSALALPHTIVEPCDAKSGENEQPFGQVEGMRGARTRREGVKAKAPKADLWIGIENCVYEAGPDDWYDAAAISIETPDGKIVEVWSLAIRVPTHMVQIVKDRGANETTIGRVYKEFFPKADHQDPHFHITGGLLKRERILADALIAAIAQL